MLVELARLSPTDVYHLMTQVIVPRPIAWVVSEDPPGDAPSWNLAPYSYFNAVSSDPPTVMFSVSRSQRPTGPGAGDVKDTLANVTARPVHTIALPGRSQVDQVEATASTVPPGTSEFTLADLEPVAWDWPVPRPAGARVALGCTVDRIVPVGDGPQRIVLSRIERIWVDPAVVGEDAKGRLRVDAALLDPLARLGAGEYAGLTAPFRPARPAQHPRV